jgi:hypothetical protein
MGTHTSGTPDGLLTLARSDNALTTKVTVPRLDGGRIGDGRLTADKPGHQGHDGGRPSRHR